MCEDDTSHKVGVYHCILDNVTTAEREEMVAHLDRDHPGKFTSDDPDDFFYEKGDSYRIFCVRDSRGRKPGCGFQTYRRTEDSAKSIAESHSKNHEATYEPFADDDSDGGA